ncbi:MAG TPA: hypothetical protein VD995_25420 [Azospirillum sp.]|nr:hypothetical protein [Azospirillum sp.]
MSSIGSFLGNAFHELAKVAGIEETPETRRTLEVLQSADKKIDALIESGPKSKIHAYNGTNEKFYVLATPNKDWLVVDVIQSVLTFNLNVIGTLASEAKTMGALFEIIGGIAGVYSITNNAIRLSNKTNITKEDFAKVKEAVERIKANSVTINPDELQVVGSEHICWPPRYLSASGLASAVKDASTWTLCIFNEDMTKIARFDTNCDHSWIISPNAVVRSEYNTVRVPKAGGEHHSFG